MYSLKLIGFLLMLRSFVCDCNWEPPKDGFAENNFEYKVRKIGKMPKRLQETSGLALAEQAGSFWTHNDSGGDNLLFKINHQGALLDSIAVEGVRNTDWEDLARDEDGNIYIGDFGNNRSKRKDLKIYKLSPDFKKVEIINFSYPDQEEFPPPKEDMNFDCEAFFWYKGQLQLFSKNWGKKWVTHYMVPDQPGTYMAFPAQEFYLSGMVTAADISPDQKTIALLSYGKIYLFKVDPTKGFFNNPYKCIHLFRGKQSESIAFINDTDFVVGNETGQLFEVKVRERLKK